MTECNCTDHGWWGPGHCDDCAVTVEKDLADVCDERNRLRSALVLALADLKVAATWTSDNNFQASIEAAQTALGEE